MNTYFLPHLTTEEIAARQKQGCTTVLVPLGSTEQHGPALPLKVDNAHGRETCLRMAARLGNALVAGEIPFGYAPQHQAFAGSVSIREVTLSSLVEDIGVSLLKSGFKLVYFWIAHAESHPALMKVLQKNIPGLDGLRDLPGYLSATWGIMGEAEGVSAKVAGSHAGEIEASMMRAMDDRLVRMDAAACGCLDDFPDIVDRMMEQGMEAVSANGVLGDQRAADVARGHRYLDRLADWGTQDVRRAQQATN